MALSALIARYGLVAVFAGTLFEGETVLPLALGMSRVRTARFLAFNILSALLWAPLAAALGYAFGAALAAHPQLLERYDLAAMALVAAVALLARVLHRRAQHKLNAR